VRVRIAVPQGGFGQQLNVMHGWLNMHAGRGNLAIHGAPNHLGRDAADFYGESVRGAVRVWACRGETI
jgi:hypothetical protein